MWTKLKAFYDQIAVSAWIINNITNFDRRKLPIDFKFIKYWMN